MQPLPMSFFDGLTGYFPEGEVFAYGSTRKPKTVRKNGTKVYTFTDKSGEKADGVTHHLIQRPDGKYILKVDDGDHRNDRDDIAVARGRTPLRAGGSGETKGKTNFQLIGNGSNNGCYFLCFSNDGGMSGSGSDRRSERTASQLAQDPYAATVQQGSFTPIGLSPVNNWWNGGVIPGEKCSEPQNFSSYSESVDYAFDNCMTEM